MAGVTFAQRALRNPTRHNHAVSLPGVPFGVSNGVGHSFNGFVNPIGGGYTTLIDHGVNHGTGLVANVPINHQFAQLNDEKWNADQTSGLEQFVFRNGSSHRTASHTEAEGYIVSLYALNYYLSTEQGRREYADDWDFKKFRSSWHFIGVQKSKEGGDSMIMQSDVRVMTVVVGGRAHVPDITRSQENVQDLTPNGALSMYRRGTVNDNDVVWLVPRKYQKDGMLYVKIMPYVTTNRMPPPLEVCSGYITYGGETQYWSTSPIRVGFVNIVHGDRSRNQKRVDAARRVLAGNDGSNDQRWKDLQSLGRIDLMLGLNH